MRDINRFVKNESEGDYVVDIDRVRSSQVMDRSLQMDERYVIQEEHQQVDDKDRKRIDFRIPRIQIAINIGEVGDSVQNSLKANNHNKSVRYHKVDF